MRNFGGRSMGGVEIIKGGGGGGPRSGEVK